MIRLDYRWWDSYFILTRRWGRKWVSVCPNIHFQGSAATPDPHYYLVCENQDLLRDFLISQEVPIRIANYYVPTVYGHRQHSFIVDGELFKYSLLKKLYESFSILGQHGNNFIDL